MTWQRRSLLQLCNSRYILLHVSCSLINQIVMISLQFITMIFFQVAKDYLLWAAVWLHSNNTMSCSFKCVFLKWLKPLDFVVWGLSLFLWAFLSVASKSILNKFGFVRFKKGEIISKEISNHFKRLEQ